MRNPISDLLRYWHGDLKDGEPIEDRNRLWFGGEKSDDDDMRAQFGGLIAAACAGELADWEATDEGGMALILLTDQMTRATRRGTPAAFAGDLIALAVCKNGVRAGRDKRLPSAYRRFYYLPLEHSENLADQKECVALFESLRDEFPRREKDLQEAVDYAQKHLDIIAEFGRFPHRNAILGRASTPAEERYLAGTTERFGQSAE